MCAAVRAVTSQPMIGAVTLGAALMALLASLLWPAAPPVQPDSIAVPLAMLLGACVAIAHRYPIHVRHDTNICVYSVPAYLCVVLLPPSMAATTIGLATIVGEISVRRERGGHLSDIASQVGRWVMIALAGSIVAHAAMPWPFLHTLPLIMAAGILWTGDILTFPLLLGPITKERPLRIICSVAREAGPAEAGQYLIGLLGAVAALGALWTLALLLLPTILIYRAFKSANDVHEHARQLLASVVETSPDGILLLDQTGQVVLANHQAVALGGYDSPDHLIGVNVLALTNGRDRERLVTDAETVLHGGPARIAEYTMLRAGGDTFAGEIRWSRVAASHRHTPALTCVLRDITARQEAIRALEHQALHDALTGLPNRTLYNDRVGQALTSLGRDRTNLSVFLMDLNRFKQVNDTLGHHMGDLLLKQVANRLTQTLRESDTVARLSGDEFAILLPTANAADAEIVAARLIEAIEAPFTVGDHSLGIGVSIGIAVAPEHGTTATELLAQADAAMYEIKRARSGSGYAYAGETPDSLRQSA